MHHVCQKVQPIPNEMVPQSRNERGQRNRVVVAPTICLWRVSQRSRRVHSVIVSDNPVYRGRAIRRRKMRRRDAMPKNNYRRLEEAEDEDIPYQIFS
jgi:hypothetical protein